jgi:hypothetical protein
MWQILTTSLTRGAFPVQGRINETGNETEARAIITGTAALSCNQPKDRVGFAAQQDRTSAEQIKARYP